MERMLVIGAAVIDIAGVGSEALAPGDSLPGDVHLAVGGVGKNVAENLARLQVPSALVTCFGDDAFAPMIENHLKAIGIDATRSLRKAGPSGKYLSLHHADGVLLSAVNDFRLFERLVPTDFAGLSDYVEGFDWLVLDANLPEPVLADLTDRFRHKKIACDGVSRAKVGRLRAHLAKIALLKVNRGELAELAGTSAEDVIYTLRDLLSTGVGTIVVTDGPDPITYNIGRRIFQSAIYAAASPVSSSGAGDALLSGILYGLAGGLGMHDAVNRGKKAASLTMTTAAPCHPLLSPQILEE